MQTADTRTDANSTQNATCTSQCHEKCQGSQIDSVPAGYAYLQAPVPNAHFFNLDAHAKDSKRDKDFIPDLRTDEGTSTG